jgi:chemotaxis protein methyltransferase CheR
VTWSHPAYEDVVLALGRKTGLSFAPARHVSVEQGIRRAMRRAGTSDLVVYRNAIDQEGQALDDLIVELTVGETWFFREPAQLAFIRSEVLPGLQRAARVPDQPGPCVRAWSAGCASGEEAYTLAILLEEAGVGDRAWVLATDISQAALARARQAVYTNWSLRGDGAVQARPYLQARGDKQVVAEAVRRRVTFAHLNLARDVYPSFATGAWGMDLILCRNVLIYFDPETVRAVAGRLFATLAPGGWLFTASSDPPLGSFAPFQTVLTDQGVFYRRPGSAGLLLPAFPPADSVVAATVPVKPPLPLESAPVFAPPVSLPSTVPAPETNLSRVKRDNVEPLTEARAAFARGDYDQVLDLTAPLTADAEASALRVRALANLDHARAERESAAAVSRHPLRADLHYLRGTLLLGVGKTAEAAQAIRKALYLDRSLAVAHCALGNILEQCGDAAGARRAYRNARALCAARAADEEIPLADGERAGRLAEAARARLALLGEDGGQERRANR